MKTHINFPFTFDRLKAQYQAAIDQGYKIITCENYSLNKTLAGEDKILINRVDIDFSIKKAETLGKMFNDLDIKASFFVRLHAPEYNPFSFENYRIIKYLIDSGHEVGYHSEIVDQAAIWNEKSEECLIRDIDILNRMFGINIKGVASHGGMTGLNNLDFWKENRASTYGLLYEAYDWINDCFYISDSEWTRWKCYNKGKQIAAEYRSFGEHVMDKHPLIYLLIHSDTYFDQHFYE